MPLSRKLQGPHTQKRDPENNREFRLLWSNGPFPLTWLFPPRLYKVPVSSLQTSAYIPISPEEKKTTNLECEHRTAHWSFEISVFETAYFTYPGFRTVFKTHFSGFGKSRNAKAAKTPDQVLKGQL